jgi:hypothetical protein
MRMRSWIRCVTKAHHQEAERVLSQHHAAEHVEKQARKPCIPEASDARRGQDEVDHREQSEIRSHWLEPARQRHDRKHEARGHAEPVQQPAREHDWAASFALLGWSRV